MFDCFRLIRLDDWFHFIIKQKNSRQINWTDQSHQPGCKNYYKNYYIVRNHFYKYHTKFRTIAKFVFYGF